MLSLIEAIVTLLPSYMSTVENFVLALERPKIIILRNFLYIWRKGNIDVMFIKDLITALLSKKSRNHERKSYHKSIDNIKSYIIIGVVLVRNVNNGNIKMILVCIPFT